MNIFEKKILLASASPRRHYILKQSGFEFRVLASDVDETYPLDMDPADVPVYLAEKKAHAVQPLASPDEIIIAADSIVTRDRVIYEKPTDHPDAMRMLSALSGKKHEVITGVCLLRGDQKVSFADISQVFFENLTNEEIKYYIETYKPYDKAGSYGVQEWLGFCKIRRIEGSYVNIMGLPMPRVYEALKHF